MELSALLLVVLALLICPISMSVMMWSMNTKDDDNMHMKPDDSVLAEHTEKTEV